MSSTSLFDKLFSFWFGLLDSFDERLWRLISPKQPKSLVLMYHHIVNGTREGDRSCVHTKEEFIHTISRLEAESYEFVSIEKIITPLLRRSKQKKLVTVTFDDVSSDFLVNAYPFLKEKKIPFTLFIAICFVNQDGFLSEEQILELAKDPLCTIGAHTLTHSMLRKSNNSLEELKQSKDYLEKLTGCRVDYLAYPYGKHSSVSMRVMNEAKKTGFKRAFGTIDAPITKFTRLFKYYLPRMVVHN